MLLRGGVGHWIERWAQIEPGRCAIKFDGTQISRRALFQRADALAGWLKHRGVQRGDRVALLMDNHPDFFTAFWGVVRSGAVFVPLSPRLADAERDEIVHRAKPRVIVTSAALAGRLTAGAGRPEVVVMGTGDFESGVLAAGRYRGPRLELGLDDPLAILFTSGTTGKPKGVVITHGAVLFMTMDLIIGAGLGTDDVHLVTLPLCFTGGLLSSSMMVFHTGATMILEPAFEPARALRLIESERVTVMLGVPTIYRMMRNDPAFAAADLSSLRLASCGGAPTPADLDGAWLDKGVTLVHPYGMTETAGSASFMPVRQAPGRRSSIGRPALYCDVQVHGEPGATAGPGEIGDLVLSGPHLMDGYLDDELTTSEVLRDGWLQTGDRGYTDADGYFYVVGRSKDMVITGGLNVYPAEVENVISDLPWVSECAVAGRPDPHWGVSLVAAIVPTEPGHAAGEVAAHCRAQIASYKVPREVFFVDALPKSESGKVLKSELLSQLGLAGGAQAAV
jgi:fatty-acyl-CoA synthase